MRRKSTNTKEVSQDRIPIHHHEKVITYVKQDSNTCQMALDVYSHRLLNCISLSRTPDETDEMRNAKLSNNNRPTVYDTDL